MIIKYIPSDNIIVFNGINIKFFDKREAVRNNIGMPYEEDNSVFASDDFDPDPIVMRRDIYVGERGEEYFFFLDYDKDDLLGEIEIIKCDKIQLNKADFGFKDELDSIALLLSNYSEISILSDGEYFFKDLKVVISDERNRGGEDSTLGYFYCAADVSHLE